MKKFMNAVSRAFPTLDETEQRIIIERVIADEPRTLQSLGDDFGLTRERVRQLEARALRKLRKELEDKGLIEDYRVLTENNETGHRVLVPKQFRG